MKHFVYLITLFVFSANVGYATIYMQKDEQGNIIYSDIPIKNGMKIEVTSVNASTNVQPATTNTEITSTVIETKSPAYKVFLITSPKDQQTIQNQTNVPVEIELQPDLQPGNKILLLLDNRPWGNPIASKHLDTGQIDRGTHTISALIIDERQRILKQSNTVTIFFHRTTLNSPARQTSEAKPTPLAIAPAPPISPKNAPIQTNSFVEAIIKLLG